ncbi:hypothetical protein [Halorussus sp. MSC15.2]|uniref:hypothetical protein n=1 Tax=Halorussus sp. MSC15.2 TaxID=2283638 RepID=UPI0013D2F3AA|nr:hypothetical protein [Halorussus sp. MSC15.2]NEU56109.1 hypothetical protein [Halorussus sp. MSC15.2]
MRLRTDDRGVTVQIGTVLLFAVLIVLLSTYQASVVPQQNEQVEFNHNQQVQSQLQDFRDELLRTAVTGSGGSASVALGTRYPVRAFFVNPAPPSGTLATTSPADVRLVNAKAAGETGDYWNGDDRSFRTRGVTYEPLYHVYQDPPTTVYRNGVLYNRFDDANRIEAGQRLVRGNTVSLVALGGSLSKSSSGTASVNIRPVSSATRTVTVRNEDGEELAVVVPTKLSVTEWRELLEGERDPEEDDPGKHVTAVEDAGSDRVRISLEPGVYELRLAKVGVGSDVNEPTATYAVDVEGNGATVRADGTQRVVAEVRDEFNNPVSGVSVTVTDSPSGGDLYDAETGDPSDTTVTTDDRGRAVFTYDPTADAGGTGTDTFALGFDGPDDDDTEGSTAAETVPYEVHVRGQSDTGGGDHAYRVDWREAESDADNGNALTCDSDETCTWDASASETVTLTVGTDPTAQNADVAFSVSDTSVASVSGSAIGTTGPDGTTTVTVRAEGNGEVRVYGSSGGSGDALTIDVRNFGDGGGGTAGVTYTGESRTVEGTQSGVRSVLQVELRNELSDAADLTAVKVNSTQGPGKRIRETESGVGEVEIDVDGDGNSDSTTDRREGWAVGERISLASRATVGSGDTAVVQFFEFRKNNGDPVDMQGRRATVTVYYETADGETKTTTFTVNA